MRRERSEATFRKIVVGEDWNPRPGPLLSCMADLGVEWFLGYWPGQTTDAATLLSPYAGIYDVYENA